MTNIYITNVNNSVTNSNPDHIFYISIEATNIDRDYVNNIKVTLNRPKARSSQTTKSVTQFIDLQQKTKSVTITGVIDRCSLMTSGLTPILDTKDPGVIKQYLEYMFDRGGLNEVVIGQGDGFYTTGGYPYSGTPTPTYVERVQGIIMRMSIKEDSSDRVSKEQDSYNYPVSTLNPERDNPSGPYALSNTKKVQVKIPNKYSVTINLVE